MRQTVQVKRLLPGGSCEVWVGRSSACGGSCATCGMGESCSSVATAAAENPMGAQPGDTVIVETGTGTLSGVAMLAYLVPALLAILCGVLAESLWPGMAPAGVFAGLLLGVAIAWAYGKSRRKSILRVVEIVKTA